MINLYTFLLVGSSVISWKKDNSFLSLGASPLSDDPRLSVIMTDSSSTLTITLVRIEDAGEYVCHVATNPTPIAKTFSVEIKGELRKEICRAIQM